MTIGGINLKMDSDSITQIFVLAVLILVSAYFSASETAFSSFNRIRLKNMANDGNRKAALALKMADEYDKLLSTILIGNNIVNIAASSIATIMFIRILQGTTLTNHAATIATVVITVAVLLLVRLRQRAWQRAFPSSL